MCIGYWAVYMCIGYWAVYTCWLETLILPMMELILKQQTYRHLANNWSAFILGIDFT